MSASLLPRCLDGTGVCWCLVLHGNPCGWTKSNSLHACEVHDQLMEIVRLEAPGSLAFWESTSHADKENTRQAGQRPCLSIVLLWPGPSDAQGQGALLASFKVPRKSSCGPPFWIMATVTALLKNVCQFLFVRGGGFFCLQVWHTLFQVSRRISSLLHCRPPRPLYPRWKSCLAVGAVNHKRFGCVGCAEQGRFLQTMRAYIVHACFCCRTLSSKSRTPAVVEITRSSRPKPRHFGVALLHVKNTA